MPRSVRIDVGTANFDLNGQAWNTIQSVDVFPDETTPVAVDLGFTLNFGAGDFSSVFINENGFVSFGTPIAWNPAITNLSQLNGNVIAPYYADLTSVGSSGPLPFFVDGTVSYTTGAIDLAAPFETPPPATPAFRVTWFNVGVPGYSGGTGTIQLVLFDIDGSAGTNFDLEFAYDLFDPPPPITAGYALGTNPLFTYAGPFQPDGQPGSDFLHFCSGSASATSCTPATQVPEPDALSLLVAGLLLLAAAAWLRAGPNLNRWVPGNASPPLCRFLARSAPRRDSVHQR
jgi:hypothetical protein